MTRAGLSPLVTESGASRRPRQYGRDLRMIALGESVADATIAPIAQRQFAERAVPGVIVHCRGRGQITAMAFGAGCEAEHRLPCRPRPEPISPGDDVENTIEGQLARRPAVDVIGV